MSSKVPLSLLCALHLCLLTSVLAGEQKCRGLSLEGGGDRGAYQAGIISGLFETLSSEEFQYDVVSGISAGSINSSFFGLFPKGQEDQVVSQMLDIWNTVKSTDLFQNWPWGPIQGLTSESGLFDTSPGRDLMDRIIGTGPHQERSVFMGTSNINNGEFHALHNQDLSREDYINAVVSSSAVPFVFPDAQWNGMVAVDGGTKVNLNTLSVITECRARGFADEDIIIDSGFCFGFQLPKMKSETISTMEMLFRTLDIFVQDVATDFLPRLKEAYPKVNFRYFVMPGKEHVPDFIVPLVFNHEDIEKMLKAGHDRAVEVVKNGPGIEFDRLIQMATEKQQENLDSLGA